jgi:uncharacterized protein (TIGR02118 family)
MIKLVYCLRRRADLSFEAFSRYWRDEHAVLVKRIAPLLGVVRYVQSHATAQEVNGALRESRNLLEPYDGIAEIYFDDLESMEKAHLAPAAEAAQRELTEDEDKFLDRKRCCLFVTEEHLIIGS